MNKLILSVDDASSSDRRIAMLAHKYDIECIFYWPTEWHSLAYDKGYEPLSYPDAFWISRNFEIGSHTITHRHLTAISQVEAEYEIRYSQEILEALFGVTVDNFAPPRGYTNDLLTEYTMKFYKKQRLTKGKGLVHIHPDSGANGNKPWRDCIDDQTEEIWCHGWELSKYNLWDELEQFLRENV